MTGSSSARSERIRSVFLFTDGEATTGVTNTAQLTSIISVMLENPIRPTIHCFGFGQRYDSACLDSICQAGQGQSYFIEDAESIPGALSSALGGLMSMAAQNVELTFTPKVRTGLTNSHILTISYECKSCKLPALASVQPFCKSTLALACTAWTAFIGTYWNIEQQCLMLSVLCGSDCGSDCLSTQAGTKSLYGATVAICMLFVGRGCHQEC
jgi:hypothetical protein